MEFKRDGNLYIVTSTSDKSKSYKVDIDAPSCTCAHFLFRLRKSGGECKHIKSVKEELKKERVEVVDDVCQGVIADIKAGNDDVVELIEKYGKDVISQMKSDGDVFEKQGRLNVLD